MTGSRAFTMLKMMVVLCVMCLGGSATSQGNYFLYPFRFGNWCITGEPYSKITYRSKIDCALVCMQDYPLCTGFSFLLNPLKKCRFYNQMFYTFHWRMGCVTYQVCIVEFVQLQVFMSFHRNHQMTAYVGLYSSMVKH